MKTGTLPAFMVRQHALTNDEWIQCIRALAGKIMPHLNNLTLKGLAEVGILLDDFGRHPLRGYSIGNQPHLSQQGIFPFEDEKISTYEYFFGEDDIEKTNPIRLVQRFWCLSRRGVWMTVEVRSDITYVDVDIHKHQRRLIPTSVEVLPAVLNAEFFEFIGLTPKKFWYRFEKSTTALLDERQKVLTTLVSLVNSIEQHKFQLSLIPDGALESKE